jgi:GH24 family phage-related lysozyme (muramidase)
MTCTKADASQWLHEELDTIAPQIVRVCGVPLQQQQLDALASFVYNLGIGNFQSSTLLKNIKARRPVTETNFTLWCKARINGKLEPLPGLLRRRRAEHFLYTQGRVKVQFT